MDTLVAEIYGPNAEKQVEIAGQIKDIFSKIKGIVDVDWYVEAPQSKITFAPDKEKAALNGVGTDAISQTLTTAISGMPVGLVHFDKEKEPVEIMLRMPMQYRSGVNGGDGFGAGVAGIAVPTQSGNLIPLSALVKEQNGVQDQTIYHKNQRRVTYVIGDVAKEIESPVYAVLDMQGVVSKLKLSDGSKLKQLNIAEADREDKYSVKWDGEWHITLQVFRDMGIAFAAVLVLIYVLVVAWFKDFVTPLVIMAPIPLTLVGILPGHLIFHAFFTATSMIGFIALSGIIVRNSILLVDFIQLEMAEGNDLKNAVIKAGLVRFRPILLTALAVVVGSFVMLFDPIFQGLAIAMMFGAVVATILTLVVVPVLYYEMKSKQ
jgi:multidrug efflux pump subunit AcrB